MVPRNDIDALRAAVGESTAAVLLEPIQGESGIHPLEPELLHAAREACDEHGALLIFDEIQCGNGRTGTLWAHEQLGAAPDVMTVAKGLGGGLPVGACVTNPDSAAVLELGDHGSTFAGGPVIAAAANAVLDVLTEPGFLGTVTRAGRSARRRPARARPRAARARPDGRLRPARRPGAWRAVCCSSSAWWFTRPARRRSACSRR